MGYTAPSSQTTGTLITASIWNTDIVDNIIELKRLIDLNAIYKNYNDDTQVGPSDTTETDVMSLAVAANAMGTGNAYRLLHWYTLKNQSGGAAGSTIRFKADSTVLDSYADTGRASQASIYSATAYLFWVNHASAAEQIYDANYGGAMSPGGFHTSSSSMVTTTFDTTNAFTLKISHQNSISDANVWTVSRYTNVQFFTREA